jgi:hypothetical protein
MEYHIKSVLTKSESLDIVVADYLDVDKTLNFYKKGGDGRDKLVAVHPIDRTIIYQIKS